MTEKLCFHSRLSLKRNSLKLEIADASVLLELLESHHPHADQQKFTKGSSWNIYHKVSELRGCAKPFPQVNQ